MAQPLFVAFEVEEDKMVFAAHFDQGFCKGSKAQDVETMWLVSQEWYSKPNSCRSKLKSLFHFENAKQMQQDPQNFLMKASENARLHISR